MRPARLWSSRSELDNAGLRVCRTAVSSPHQTIYTEAVARKAKMAARVAGCLLILIALGTRPPLAAQTPKPDPTQIFRSFRLVATGADGQPVTDLRPEEIQVSDEGKRYPLVFARLLAAPSKAAALGPREFSNRAQDRFSASTLIL